MVGEWRANANGDGWLNKISLSGEGGVDDSDRDVVIRRCTGTGCGAMNIGVVIDGVDGVDESGDDNRGIDDECDMIICVAMMQ